MALESSDLNDGTILQQTRQITDSKGHITFIITLPSGRELKSDPISPDNARKAIFTWIDAVKSNAVADAKAEQEEKRALARRAAGKMDIERKPGDDQPLFRAGGARDMVPQTQAPIAQDAGSGEQALAHDYDALQRAEVSKETIQPGKIVWVSDAVPKNPIDFARAQYTLHLNKVMELRPQLRAYEDGLAKWEIILLSLEELEADVVV